jgi:hypothetical protein
MKHIVPPEWIRDAGLHGFEPSTPGYRCDDEHQLVAIADIAPIERNEGVTLDTNGFGRDRMMRILFGVHDGDSMPPILIWPAESGSWRFELRCGFHRYYASRTLKFSHVPANIGERY